MLLGDQSDAFMGARLRFTLLLPSRKGIADAKSAKIILSEPEVPDRCREYGTRVFF